TMTRLWPRWPRADMRRSDVATPDGLTLATQESGTPTGPAILFLHGFSQSSACWRAQMSAPSLQGFRMVAYDIRGHGHSSQPTDPATYQDNTLFAQDTHAVITALNLHEPVLVGWSYAGRLINDYVTAYGTDQIAGINYVCARTKNDPAFNGPGNRFLKAMQGADRAAEIIATRQFLRACFTVQPDPATLDAMLAYNMLCRPETRRAHLSRAADDGAVLSTITVPTLITQGTDDLLVSQGLAHVTAAMIPHAELSLYHGSGHAPFAEDSARFNRELAAFVTACATRFSVA
ncbi:MAG: alpha/beta hydrolase, partial [Paracoccaceae bacterium]